MAITEYKGTSPKVRIPDTIDGEPVVSADLGDADITELIIPDSLKKLSYNGTYLEYCNVTPNLNPASLNVNQVYIQDGVIEICGNAFWECTNLTSVMIPDSMTSIGNGAFFGCENIKATYKGKTYTYDDIHELYDAVNNSNNRITAIPRPRRMICHVGRTEKSPERYAPGISVFITAFQSARNLP